MLANELDDVLEGLGHQECAGPVKAGGHTGSATSDLGRQDLAHHQPGDRAETEREADYVDDEAGQRKPAVGHRVDVAVFHVEEAAEGYQGHYHANAAHVQENLATEAIDQGCSYECGAEVHDADYDGADVRVNCAACIL